MASWASLLSGILGSAVNLFGPGGGNEDRPKGCTYVVVERLGHSVEEEASADTTGKQHGEPDEDHPSPLLAYQEASLYSGVLPSGPSLRLPYLLKNR